MKYTKLPKQWVHWAKKAGLNRGSRYRKYNLKGDCLYGLDRVWRVNCDNIFECSCPVEYFDRWANSRGSEWNGIPQTEKEFLNAVKILVE
jgi:hypothetical protein